MNKHAMRPARIGFELVGVIPFLVLIAAWKVGPSISNIPAYMLPSIESVWSTGVKLTSDGTLLENIGASLYRLGVGFVLGNIIAIPIGIGIALNRHLSDTLRPTLVFFQSIAGVAWIPLAVIWFGIGMGSVIFVIANTIFFTTLYNAVAGVESIPKVLRRAVLSHGGSGWRYYADLILPGAFVNILLGMRMSMARGWHALVGAEMIAGSNGLGYMTMESVQWYQTSTIILGMICIGVIWLVLDRLIFRQIERRTVVRWGLLQK